MIAAGRIFSCHGSADRFFPLPRRMPSLLLALALFIVTASGDCCGYRDGILQGCAYSTFIMSCSCIVSNPPPYENQCYECFCGPSATFLAIVIGVPLGLIVLSIIACCFCCSCCCLYRGQKQQVVVQQHHGPMYSYPPQAGNQEQPLLYQNQNAKLPNNCHSCGSTLIESELFCRQCGTRVQGVDAVQ
jgi:hypothetical protein